MSHPAFPVTPENAERNHGHPGLSAKEYAAIQLREPSSGTKWLDEMILRANEWQFISSTKVQVALLQYARGDQINPSAVVSAILNA